MLKRISAALLTAILLWMTMGVSAVAEDGVFIPSQTSPVAPREGETGYWVLPMDITDEQAVWEMLMAPVTVVSTGVKNETKTQVILREQPDAASEGTGMVTCGTQSVRVLETLENGWSLIECYSSSFHDSPVKKWNELVQGYVETRYLKEVTPNQEFGMVVDKLTQRLYLFRDGKLLTTLLVSTGLVNKKQPYNETRSGEFLLQTPAVGGFTDGDMTSNYGIRFNDGDLLHEVPHRTGSSDYSSYEGKLGTKASHGCIRTQRRTTPEGINMKWIWNHRKNNIKFVIWEDWQGRQIPYPEDDFIVYVNPKNPSEYHRLETCKSTKKKVLSPIAYSDLETDTYRKTKRCKWCTPVMTRAEIDAVNEAYRAE